MKKITIQDEQLLIESFDYALGRSSTSVSDVTSFLSDIWKDLSFDNQNYIQTAIRKAIKDSNIGMDMDKKEWLNILSLKPDENSKVEQKSFNVSLFIIIYAFRNLLVSSKSPASLVNVLAQNWINISVSKKELLKREISLRKNDLKNFENKELPYLEYWDIITNFEEIPHTNIAGFDIKTVYVTKSQLLAIAEKDCYKDRDKDLVTLLAYMGIYDEDYKYYDCFCLTITDESDITYLETFAGNFKRSAINKKVYTNVHNSSKKLLKVYLNCETPVLNRIY